MCRSKFGEEQIISTCASKKRKRRSAKRASATGSRTQPSTLGARNQYSSAFLMIAVIAPTTTPAFTDTRRTSKHFEGCVPSMQRSDRSELAEDCIPSVK
jgi:hypothetical protein